MPRVTTPDSDLGTDISAHRVNHTDSFATRLRAKVVDCTRIAARPAISISSPTVSHHHQEVRIKCGDAGFTKKFSIVFWHPVVQRHLTKLPGTQVVKQVHVPSVLLGLASVNQTRPSKVITLSFARVRESSHSLLVLLICGTRLGW